MSLAAEALTILCGYWMVNRDKKWFLDNPVKDWFLTQKISGKYTCRAKFWYLKENRIVHVRSDDFNTKREAQEDAAVAAARLMGYLRPAPPRLPSVPSPATRTPSDPTPSESTLDQLIDKMTKVHEKTSERKVSTLRLVSQVPKTTTIVLATPSPPASPVASTSTQTTQPPSKEPGDGVRKYRPAAIAAFGWPNLLKEPIPWKNGHKFMVTNKSSGFKAVGIGSNKVKAEERAYYQLLTSSGFGA